MSTSDIEHSQRGRADEPVAEPPDGGGAPYYGVKVVVRAVEILEEVRAAGKPLTLAEMAARVHRSKSTVFDLIRTLADQGLLRRTITPDGARYSLGLELARLGSFAVAQFPFHDIALPVVRGLASRTGMAARATVLHRTNAIVVAQAAPAGRITRDLQMHGTEPLYATAQGKAILATVPRDALRQILTTVDFEKRTARTKASVEVLEADLESVRDRGFAVDDEEDFDGIMCIAAPVFNADNNLLGAIGISAAKADLMVDGIDRIGLLVMEAAEQIGAGLE